MLRIAKYKFYFMISKLDSKLDNINLHLQSVTLKSSFEHQKSILRIFYLYLLGPILHEGQRSHTGALPLWRLCYISLFELHPIILALLKCAHCCLNFYFSFYSSILYAWKAMHRGVDY